MVRARPPRRAAARLGDAALRQLLAAPRSRVGAARDALPDHDRRLRRRDRAGDDRPAAHRAAVVPRRLHVLHQAGDPPRRDAAARPARDRRLQPRHPGRRARRILHPRRADRPLPDGERAPLPHRARRRRDRHAAHLRRRHAAHRVQGERGAPAAGARVPARRRGAEPLPRPVPRGVRGRPVEVAGLQGRLERRRAGRHRVLPAALLRWHRHAVRLPAGRGDARHPPRRARRDRGVLARRAVALPSAAGGPDPAPAPAGGSLPLRRAVLPRRESVRAPRPARAATCARRRRPARGRTAAAGGRRAPRRRSAAGAQGLPRGDGGAGTPRRRIARAARDDDRLPRPVRLAAERRARPSPSSSPPTTG